MIKVIIFDLDGLLVDSQPLQYKAHNQIFSKYGYPISIENWHEWIQNSYNVQFWIKKNNLPLDADLIRAEKQVIYEELVKNELKLKPGAKESVDLLSEKYRLCIASASRPASIKLVLNKFNLYSKFEKTISDKDVENGKPAPDVFLKCAEEMGVKSDECVVIEDSVAGMKAAQAANMKCVVCRDSFSDFPLSFFDGADKIIGSLEDITLETIDEIG